MENKLWEPEYWEDFFEDNFIDYIENGDYRTNCVNRSWHDARETNGPMDQTKKAYISR